MKLYKPYDIKAGYLLVVKNLARNETYNMTVIPNAYGRLGCVCPDKEWWDIEVFDEDLNFGFDTIEAIYDCTYNRMLMDNSTEDRKLLWERKDAKKMTVAEICAALGYDVEIVSENGGTEDGI